MKIWKFTSNLFVKFPKTRNIYNKISPQSAEKVEKIIQENCAKGENLEKCNEEILQTIQNIKNAKK